MTVGNDLVLLQLIKYQRLVNEFAKEFAMPHKKTKRKTPPKPRKPYAK